MGMHAVGIVGLCLGWQITGAGLVTASDDVLEAKVAACKNARDGDCLLQVAAFDDAAAVFEATARWDRAASLRTQLGQLNRAYADALVFVKGSDDAAAKEAVAHEVLAQGGLIGDDQETGLADFYHRYLRDFAPYAAKDSILVAHARFGALLMAQSCPIRSFHGGCVDIHREARNCPSLCDEHGNCGGPVFLPAKPSSGTYSVEVAVARPRDPRLVSEAKNHLRAVQNARDLAAAEKTAAPSPARARALANAKATTAFALALPDLDRFLALGGTPEDLDFAAPTQWDSRCRAEQKIAAYDYSSRRFSRWLREKLALMQRLRDSYLRVATDSDPDAAVAATALYAFILKSSSRAMVGSDDRLRQCPIAGFVHPSDGDWWDADVDDAASLCDLLANRYAIDTEHSRYCQIDAGNWLHPIGSLPCRLQPGRRCRAGASNRSAAAPVTEISPSSLFMNHVRNNDEARSFQAPMSSAPPRYKPKPPKVPCPRRGARAKVETGVLKMVDGDDLARFFSDHPRFPATLPDQLAVRFPRPFAD
jgi:hypothetical protein